MSRKFDAVIGQKLVLDAHILIRIENGDIALLPNLAKLSVGIPVANQ